MSLLQGFAAIASIITAGTVVWAFGSYRLTRHRLTKALDHMLAKKEPAK